MRRNLLYIALCATSLWAMTACSDDAIVQENNEDASGRSPIEFSAGVSNGNFNDMLTRAIITDGTGKTKRAFEKATNLFFIVKAEHATDNSKTTKWGYNYATAAAATSEQKDNGAIKADTKSSITFYDNYLYWDDAYARDTKVSVYSIGAANYERTDIELSGSKKIGSSSGYNKIIPFETPSPDPTHTLTWTIGDNSHADWQTKESISQQDLVFSNNITKHSDTEDQRLKFNTETGDKYHKFDKGDLIYYHALTKFTIQIKCGDGFKGDGSDFKFSNSPSGADNSFAINGFYGKNGTFNIANGEFATCDDNNKQNFSSIYLANTSAQKTNPYYTLYAYVIPGTDMTGTKSDAFSLEIDNNKFYISLAHLYNAIKSNTANVDNNEIKSTVLKDKKYLLPGVNYEFTFTVNKTKIDVTASIKDWEDVSAETVYPVINVSASYGDNTGLSTLGKDAFSFYRSTELNSGYSSGLAENNYYPSEAVVKKPSSGSEWYFTDGNNNAKPLYWTDHNTHYQIRGVWPLTGTGTGTVSYPRVETATHNSAEYQVIKVENVAYKAETFPSDLAIGRPNVATDAECSNNETNHTKTNLYTGGICATEGTVNLKFEYMMSQVEVNLSTTTGNDKVELVDAKVEVTNLYTSGDITLGNREAITTGDKSDYTLHVASLKDSQGNDLTGDDLIKAKNKRLDAIVPQPLTYTNGADTEYLRFKITITNNDAVLYTYDEYKALDGKSETTQEAFDALSNADKTKTPATKDIYYANIEPILESGKTTKVAPNSKWEAGKHYIYNLKLSKTVINCTATLADWVNVEGSDNIWF